MLWHGMVTTKGKGTYGRCHLGSVDDGVAVLWQEPKELAGRLLASGGAGEAEQT